MKAICQFIADQFEGKRWFELHEDERFLLLYRLRVLRSGGHLIVDSKLAGQGVPEAGGRSNGLAPGQ